MRFPDKANSILYRFDEIGNACFYPIRVIWNGYSIDVSRSATEPVKIEPKWKCIKWKIACLCLAVFFTPIGIFFKGIAWLDSDIRNLYLKSFREWEDLSKKMEDLKKKHSKVTIEISDLDKNLTSPLCQNVFEYMISYFSNKALASFSRTCKKSYVICKKEFVTRRFPARLPDNVRSLFKNENWMFFKDQSEIFKRCCEIPFKNFTNSFENQMRELTSFRFLKKEDFSKHGVIAGIHLNGNPFIALPLNYLSKDQGGESRWKGYLAASFDQRKKIELIDIWVFSKALSSPENALELKESSSTRSDCMSRLEGDPIFCENYLQDFLAGKPLDVRHVHLKGPKLRGVSISLLREPLFCKGSA